MAINTINKRLSMIAIPGITPVPVPDGRIDVYDRRMCAETFSTTLQPSDFFFWRSRNRAPAPGWQEVAGASEESVGL